MFRFCVFKIQRIILYEFKPKFIFFRDERLGGTQWAQ